MDIEQFYSADERRRQSAEIEFGNNWYDAKGQRYELSWVEDTGEFYAMLELAPEADTWSPFGDIEVEDVEVGALLVTVLGTLATLGEVEALLDGWAAHMAEPDGVHWVAERLVAAGITRPTLD
ncbi:MAG: hypothetical protein WCI26_04010 [Acidimicrobiales bacterium]|jgi:hypothetical protein